MIRSSNDKISFSHKSFLTDTEVSKTRNSFVNVSSSNMKFTKTQLFKVVQLGEVIFNIHILWNILLSVAKKEQIELEI